jgi:tetracycline 7-halogenase / FADH2 O2-dependent halogenase
LRDVELPEFPATQALFSHFTGVGQIGDQLSNCRGEVPPYPVDDAAVHHVFEGGWIWVLKFNNGVTSAGVAATDALADQLQFKDDAAAWDRLVNLLPAVKKQFDRAEAIRPFSHMPRVAFRSRQMAGARWAMLPSAAGFVDPLLSTGFPLTLLGVKRLAKVIEKDFESAELSGSLQEYARKTEGELLAAGRLIGTLYGVMDRFPLFVSLSMLYFAAASYAEAARRLDKERLASSFLLHDDERFGTGMMRCFRMVANARSPEEMDAVEKEVARTIEPLNVAGLADAARRNWYPVQAEDLLNNAAKLDCTRREIERLLESCGFWRGSERPNVQKKHAAPGQLD